MRPYSAFAEYYDELMRDVDYAARAAYIGRIFARHGLRPKLILDAACGTGSLTLELARDAEVIGVDISPQMLSKASEKAGSTNGRALFICQDIRSLDLYGTIDAAVCSLDGINHLTSPRGVRQAFDRISLFLNPGGLFVFDLNSPYKMAEKFADNVFVYDTERVCCIWQNQYCPASKLCRFALTFFERADDVYRRYDEEFAERAYTTRQIRNFLRKSGLRMEAAYADPTFEAPDEKTERILYVARKETAEYSDWKMTLPVDKEGCL